MPDWTWPEFEWDEDNAEHIIGGHDVYPDEVEEVFHNGPHVLRGGDRYRVFGQMDSGRYLFIICELRGSTVRIVTARDMTPPERRYYERHR